jgi:hypothetical protein
MSKLSQIHESNETELTVTQSTKKTVGSKTLSRIRTTRDIACCTDCYSFICPFQQRCYFLPLTVHPLVAA